MRVQVNDSILTNIENIIAEDEISNCDIEEVDVFVGPNFSKNQKYLLRIH